MSFPAPDKGADVTTYDKTANTFSRSVDQSLWPALMAKSPLLAMIPRFKVNHSTFEWETQNEPTRLYTEASSTSTTIDGSGAATNNTVVFSSGTGLEEGMLLRNTSRATPVGTYGADEIMLVTAVSTATCTVVRDYQYQNTGTGSTVHASGDVFEVIGNIKGEGSSPDANKYRDVTLVTAYTEIKDFYLEVTGSQMESERLVAADTVQAQVELGTRKLANELEAMFLYGALNTGAAAATTYNAGSDSYARTTKGLQSYIAASGSNVDYSTKAVTEAALNSRFAAIIEDKTDPMDKFLIVCHPANARTMSHFGEDVVRTTQDQTVWGRSIQTFKSDLGIEADIIWTLNCSKSDVWIIDMNKVGIAEFRPWKQTVWDYNSDGVDAWRCRVLGEYGVKVVDGTYSHAALSYITW
jgi:hypothetical protein